jgi:hypothetical protein
MVPWKQIPEGWSEESASDSSEKSPRKANASSRARRPKRTIFELAESHRTPETLLFAVAIYDFKHAEIIKVLKDDEYWESLNRIAGSRIMAFSFHCPASQSNKSSPPRAGFDLKVKSLLSEHFGVVEDMPMPAILFFQIDQSEVIAYCFAKVAGETIEETFRDARSILETASLAIADVVPKNFGNRWEIFKLAENQLSQRRTGQLIASSAKSAISLKAFASIFFAVFGMAK